MKKKTNFFYLLLTCVLVGQISLAQIPAAPAIPNTYHFDRELIQVFSGKKGAVDSCRLHFYFTNSGEYAGLRVQGMANHKGWIILGRNGNTVFFNEREKTATVISLAKIFSDMADLAKWIKMDSVMSGMRRGLHGKETKSVKTGKTKTIDGYTLEEYAVTDSSGQVALVSCAKVDFPLPIDYIPGAGVGKSIPMMSSMLQKNPLLQAIISSGELVTDVQLTDSTGKAYRILRTESIRRVPMDFSTIGYTKIDYSGYSLPEIFHAEMNRKMN